MTQRLLVNQVMECHKRNAIRSLARIS